MNQQNYNLTLGDYFLGNKRIKGQAKPINYRAEGSQT